MLAQPGCELVELPHLAERDAELEQARVATQVVFEIDEDTPACTPWNAVLRPGASATCDQLVDHCSAQLARFESPKTTFIEVLPRNPSGKVLKRALKEKL